MEPIFETERLDVRRWSPNDLDNLYEIFGDPAVWRFLPREHYESPEQSRLTLDRIIDRYTQWPGMGSFAAVERDRGETVGNALLKLLEEGPEIEVGYHISHRFWHQGYATEIARGCVRYGFARLGLERIYGVVVPENGASRRVLEKAGLTRVGPGAYYGLDCDVLAIDRPGSPDTA